MAWSSTRFERSCPTSWRRRPRGRDSLKRRGLRFVRAVQRVSMRPAPGLCRCPPVRHHGFARVAAMTIPYLRVCLPAEIRMTFFLLPELARCERSAVRHRLELGEYNVGIDRRLSDPGAVAAIAACNHVFTSDT